MNIDGKSKEEQVWRLFASMAIISSAHDLKFIRVQQFVSMVEECGLIANEKEEGKVTKHEVISWCTQARKQYPSNNGIPRKLNYAMFLRILWVMASKVTAGFFALGLRNADVSEYSSA